MAGQIFIHLGLHKTATGTLQRQFFPRCKDLNLLTTRVPAMQAFVHYVTRTDPLYFEPEHAQALLAPVLDPVRPNLLSNESFSGPPYAGVIEGGLDHRQPILANLTAVFPAARALLVLRRQDALAKSLYRQYLKSGGTRSVTRFYGLEGPDKPGLFSLDRLKFSPYVDAVHSAFPAGVLTLVYEQFSTEQQAFLEAITDFLGIALPELQLQRENATTLGPVGMEMTRWLNHIFRSLLNPAGFIPGLRLQVHGRERRISPVQLLHDHWPDILQKKTAGPRASRQRSSGGAVARVAGEILQQVQDDNRLLDQKYRLNLSKYCFY